MRLINIKDIICIDIELPGALRERSIKFVEHIIKNNGASTTLDKLKVLKYKNRFYAFEKFAMVAAAKQVVGDLRLSCSAIELKTKTEIKERVINEMFVESIAAVHVTLLLELARANNLPRRIKAHELAEITSSHRSAFYNHRDKFYSATSAQKKTPARVNLASSLDHIPKAEKGYD